MFNLADAMNKEYRRQSNLMDRAMSAHSAQEINHISELMQRAQALGDEAGKAMQKHREIQEAGAKASVESYELLKKQLSEQTEINQRLEHEFKMGAREAVITRRIAYWSLAVGIISIIVSIIVASLSLSRG